VAGDAAHNILTRKAIKELQVENEVMYVTNGKQAIVDVAKRSISSNQFSLVIVDLNMPILNGMQFLEALNEVYESRNILEMPEILFTSA